MPHSRNFLATVTVDGIPLPEYLIHDDLSTKEVSCYIPSEAGKDFAIKWKDLDTQRTTVGGVFLDGVQAGSKCIITNLRRNEASRSYIRVSHTTVRPFRFARLSLTDDENSVQLATDKLGELRLVIHALTKWNIVPMTPRLLPAPDIPQATRIHERSKKAMTHCVGYGDQMLKVPETVVSGKVYGERLITFVFHYQPLDVLRARGIAPHRTLTALVQNRKKRKAEEDVIVIEDDEVGADQRRLKTLKAEINQIEVRLSKRQKTAAVKQEYRAPILDNEVIDLT